MKETVLSGDDIALKTENNRLMAHYFPANKVLSIAALFLLLIMSWMLALIINTVPPMRDRQEQFIERAVRTETQIEAIKLHIVNLQRDMDVELTNLRKEINRLNITLNSVYGSLESRKLSAP